MSDYSAIWFAHAGREGVQAEFVRSSFPTKTFPNHFTIVTVSNLTETIQLCCLGIAHGITFTFPYGGEGGG